MRRLGHFLSTLLVASFTLLGISSRASADSISFTITSTNRVANPGDPVIFDGTISNNLASGETLDAFSYFFNFNNFDVSAFSSPLQILPENGIDFNIPSGTTSSVVELFGVTLLAGAVTGQSYPIDVTLQAVEANGNTLLGNTVEVKVTAAGGGTGTPVPEPVNLVLLASGLPLVIYCKQNSKLH